MPHAEHRTFETADEVRTFEKGRLELVEIGSGAVGRLVPQAGWRWSEHVKPIAGTEWCEAPHFQYHAAGTLRIEMTDGTQFDAGPGELTALPAGHALGRRRRAGGHDRLARRQHLRAGG